MRTFHQVGPVRTYVRGIRKDGNTVGFVPTMGALHEGHLTLIRRAKADCDFTVVSVFVNPTQFGPNEDFDAYPRTLAKDQQLAAEAGADAIFIPGVEDIYPDGFQTAIDVPELGSVLEGAHRPGHYRGVATVVAKLLNIVLPDRAYFGQKDYQQFLIIERMARDLNFQMDIVMIPTVREHDGLAMSSRNAYLSAEDREAAVVISRALRLAEERVASGITDLVAIRGEIEELILGEHRAIIDYVAVVDPDTLTPIVSLDHSPAVAAVAARFGQTRLIDNTLLSLPGAAAARSRLAKG